MIMRTPTRLFGIALLSLGLISGCASTDEATDSMTAEQAIADAKAANAEAKAANYEWRDTGKFIKEAEAKLADGDEEGALALATKAKSQATAATVQADSENTRFLNNHAGSTALIDSSSSRGAAGSVSSYSVVRGDNLWSISGKDDVYADPYQWPLIYKTNRDKIKDADLIYPGQVFDVDQNASASEIDAAVNHAKTRGAWSVGDTEQSDRDFLSQ